MNVDMTTGSFPSCPTDDPAPPFMTQNKLERSESASPINCLRITSDLGNEVDGL